MLAAHEVEEGRTYYILPTTAYGLYRYHIHDLVRVTGFHNRTPLIEFLSKGAHFANITGEKLSEYHVTAAMTDVLAELDLTLRPTAWPRAGTTRALLRPVRGARRFHEPRPGLAPGGRAGQTIARDQHGVRFKTRKPAAWLDPPSAARRSHLAAVGPPASADTGGTLEQYKHPCLIGDLKFRDTIPVEEELVAVGEPAA